MEAKQAEAGPPVAVVAVDVHKSFGDTRALRGASLVAHGGEIHAIVGENGSGKSTLIKIIAGVHRPDGGEVTVLGTPVASLDPRETQALGVATVFQEVLVADGATIAENVFLGYDGLFRERLSRADKIEHSRALLGRLLGHEIDPNDSVDDLPLSIRQWITIARALVREPKVLILDESTSALDLAGAAAVLRELERLKANGVCILLVTHRIAELGTFADRATVLRDGATVATLERENISEVRLLELMSGRKERAQVATGEKTPPKRTAAGRTLLVGEGIQLSEKSRPFSFEVREGEIVGLAGLEGEGQAELIQLLAGIRPPAAGELAFVDADERRTRYQGPIAAAKHGVVYIPGDRKAEGIFPDLSILENFGLPTYENHSIGGFVRFRSVMRAFDPYRAALALRLRSPRRLITSLSGGNQQKIIVARWLAAAPTIILLNDPTRGVDIATKRDLYPLFRRLADEERKALVFLSTEIEELIGLCDRVVVFRKQTASAELDGLEATMDDVLAAMFGAKAIEDVIAVEESARREDEQLRAQTL